jgi:hypothetical protein
VLPSVADAVVGLADRKTQGRTLTERILGSLHFFSLKEPVRQTCNGKQQLMSCQLASTGEF